MQHPEWLIEFFRFNKIKFEAIVEQRYKEPKKKLFNEFLDPIHKKQRYFALPYVHENGQILIYVGGVDAERDLVELATILRNALATSYIEHYEIIRQISKDEYAEIVLLNQFPIGCVRLTYYPELLGDQIVAGFQLVNRIIHILNRRPYLVQNVKRPTGRVLRDFYLAKENNDTDMLQYYFQEIKKGAGLGAKNLIFLEIQMLAASRRWMEIIQHSQLKHLIDGLMPPSLLQHILSALGNVGSNQFLEKTPSVEGTIEVLQSYYQNFSPIFMRMLELPKDPKYMREWQLWVVGLILLGQYKFLEKLPKFIDIQWCGEVLKIVENHGCLIKTTEDKHKELILSVPISIEQTRIYLNYCMTLPPERWYEIWSYLEKVSLEIRDYINQNSKLKEKWERIETYCSDKIIYEWSEWFEQLIFDENIDSNQILLKLYNESQIWTSNSFIESQFVKVLKSDKINVKEILRDGLPLILEWLKKNQFHLEVETILMLFTLIVDDDKSDPNDLIVFYDILNYWDKRRNESLFDAQVIMSFDELIRKVQVNPLYDLPLYQSKVEQIVDFISNINDIQQEDIDLLKNLTWCFKSNQLS